MVSKWCSQMKLPCEKVAVYPFLFSLLVVAWFVFAARPSATTFVTYVFNQDRAVETNIQSETERSSPSADKLIASIGDSHSSIKSARYMIYHCKFMCGGWADRLKGIVIAYVIATLTNRTFGIQILDNPCALTRFMQPNEVNWDIDKNVDLKSGAVIYNKLDSRPFYDEVSTSDFDKIFTSRVVLFKANLNYFSQLKLNSLYRKQLEWMQPLTYDQIFARLFRKLFRFSPDVQAALDRTFKSAKPNKNVKLLCAHVRFASNSELLHDSEKRHTEAHGETVLAFLEMLDFTTPIDKTRRENVSSSPLASSEDVRFFVTADSKHFIDKAARMFGGKFVKTEGNFVHMDRPSKDRRAACDGFTKVLVDQQLLATCDILVLSHSGLGRQSAYLRGTDRGLYCLLKNGTLTKCSTSQLIEIYTNHE